MSDNQLDINIKETGGDNALRLFRSMDTNIASILKNTKHFGEQASSSFKDIGSSVDAVKGKMSNFDAAFRSGLPTLKNFSRDTIVAFQDMINAKAKLDTAMSYKPAWFNVDKNLQQLTQLRAAAQQTTETYNRLNNVASSPKNGGGSAFNTASADRMNGSLREMEGHLQFISVYYKAMAAMNIFDAARGSLEKYADTYTNINNQMRVSLKDGADIVATNKQIFDIAQDTRTSYTATANLFTKLALSNDTLKLSQEDTLRLTKAIGQSFIESGANASETSNAILQIGQSMSKGVMNGDELRSVMENNAVIAGILAKEFGVSRGELIKLGAEGKITAQIFAGAILKNATDLQNKFATMTPTIAGVSEKLSNIALQVLGIQFSASGLTTEMTKLIDGMAAYAQSAEGTHYAKLFAETAASAVRLLPIVLEIGKAYVAWKIASGAVSIAMTGANWIAAVNNLKAIGWSCNENSKALVGMSATAKASALATATAMKGALISTGVGALLVAAGEAVGYFYKMNEGVKANDESMIAFTKSVSGLNDGLKGTKEAAAAADAELKKLSATDLARRKIENEDVGIKATKKLGEDQRTYEIARRVPTGGVMGLLKGSHDPQESQTNAMKSLVPNADRINDKSVTQFGDIIGGAKTAKEAVEELDKMQIDMTGKNFWKGSVPDAEEVYASIQAIKKLRDEFQLLNEVQAARERIQKQESMNAAQPNNKVAVGISSANMDTSTVSDKQLQALKPMWEKLNKATNTALFDSYMAGDSESRNVVAAWGNAAEITKDVDELRDKAVAIVKESKLGAAVKQAIYDTFNESTQAKNMSFQDSPAIFNVTPVIEGAKAGKQAVQEMTDSIISNFNKINQAVPDFSKMTGAEIDAYNRAKSSSYADQGDRLRSISQ